MIKKISIYKVNGNSTSLKIEDENKIVMFIKCQYVSISNYINYTISIFNNDENVGYICCEEIEEVSSNG